MWLREPAARSGDIGADLGRQKAQPKSLGFCSGAERSGPEEKHQNPWRPAQVVSGQPVGRTKTPLNGVAHNRWHRGKRCGRAEHSSGDIASVLDSPRQEKAWNFASGGAGRVGMPKQQIPGF